MTPHAFDIAILVIILLSTVTSYLRGVIREFFILAGFFLAVFVTYTSGHFLVPGLDKWLGATGGHEKASIAGLLKPSMAADIVAYGGVFLLVFGLMIMARILVTRAIQDAGLTVVDRLLGGVFGFLRGFLLVFAVYAACFYLITPAAFPDWATNSYTVPVLNKTLAWTNKNLFNLNGIIEDHGSSIAVKLNKVDLDKLG
ncbi:MAG: CvpA family protein, partial [Alphaproteobacteria bacterium]|nr:CvpA family protein [Alphaproteobacteria bacterium]